VRVFRRFLVHGVFWRRLLRFGVLIVPVWIEPAIIAFWSMLFMLWAPGRRGLMRNLTAIKPGSWAIANFFRAYRVFYNFAWTIADNVRFKEARVHPDWEFEGVDNFQRLTAEPGGAIILTAHMGNYDLGAQLFAETSDRKIVMVRAPETDPETRRFEEELHARSGSAVKIDFNTRATELALDLLESLREGNFVAIQGDRVTPGIASFPATLFGKRTDFPAGPFALAMSARVPIYPLFIFRLGRRKYRLLAGAPFNVVRLRDRDETFRRALEAWTAQLEIVVRAAWFQWFSFEPFSEELPV
jgi:phosphatidylinositol dimannoside acyltransferase